MSDEYLSVQPMAAPVSIQFKLQYVHIDKDCTICKGSGYSYFKKTMGSCLVDSVRCTCVTYADADDE